jgi:RNAse (barnase) inhibitor barstar
MKKYIIDGNNFTDYEGFIKELNQKVFIGNIWNGNLDTLNDMLFGSYGTPDKNERFIIEWKNALKSRSDLNVDQFLKWRTVDLDPSQMEVSIKKEIELAELGYGMTMFLLIINIIVAHDNIDLVLTK